MLNAMIASMLFRCTPEQVRFVMIDPKRVELTDYNDIPHLLTPVVTNPRQAGQRRSKTCSVSWRNDSSGSRGRASATSRRTTTDRGRAAVLHRHHHRRARRPDDGRRRPTLRDIICRLAQMTRATGIHLVVATQRPSVDVVTGLIKANIPSRLAFAVSSQVDSRTILDRTAQRSCSAAVTCSFCRWVRHGRCGRRARTSPTMRSARSWSGGASRGTPVYDQQLVNAQQRRRPTRAATANGSLRRHDCACDQDMGRCRSSSARCGSGTSPPRGSSTSSRPAALSGRCRAATLGKCLIGLDALEGLMRRKSAGA